MGRKTKAERTGYFYELEEQAVVDYLTTTDLEVKNEVFNSLLKPAFTKMIESIIRRYNLYIPDEEFEETFNDTISFLLTKITNFKVDKNYKAYSYCGTICKNYLICKITKFNKRRKHISSYDEMKGDIMDDDGFVGGFDVMDESTSNNTFVNELISNVVYGIRDTTLEESDVFLKANEKKIASVLVDLLVNWEDLMGSDYEERGNSNKYNKSKILYFLKENTSLSTKEIRDSLKKFKTIYYNIKEQMY